MAFPTQSAETVRVWRGRSPSKWTLPCDMPTRFGPAQGRRSPPQCARGVIGGSSRDASLLLTRACYSVMSHSALLVVLLGIDGSGRATVAERTADHIRRDGTRR